MRTAQFVILFFQFFILLANESDTLVVNRLLDRAKGTTYTDSATHYAYKSLGLAQSMGYQRGVVNAYSELGVCYWKAGLFSEAVDCLDKGYWIALEEDYTSGIISILNNFGMIFGTLGDHASAIDFFLKGIVVAEENNRPRAISKLFSNVSVAYLEIGKLDLAEQALLKSALDKDSLETASDIRQQAIFYSNQANLLLQKQEYDSAISVYSRAADLFDEINLAIGTLRAHTGLASAYLLLGQFTESSKIARKVIKDSRKSGMRVSRIKPLIILSKSLFNMDSSRQAFDHLYNALDLCDALNEIDLKAEIMFNLSSKLYEKGELQEANELLQKAYLLNDSLNSVQTHIAVSNLRLASEIHKNKRDMELIAKENIIQSQKSEKYTVVIILIGLCLLFAIVGVLLLRSRNRKARLLGNQLQKELTQKKKSLYNQTLQIIQFNNSLKEIEHSLKQTLKKNKALDIEFGRTINRIKFSRTLQKEWENFATYFNNVHEGFFERLVSENPDLSVTEQRLAGLIKMNMTNAEIARIFNIEIGSVKVAKYRLKKKIGLSDSEDLYFYIQQYPATSLRKVEL